MLLRILLIWSLNALALVAGANFVSGITVDGWSGAFIAVLVLGLVNTLIRPALLVLTLPVTVLTLGLFILVINGLMFWFAGSILRGFVVEDFRAAALGALLYSLFSWALNAAAAQLLVRKHE